MLTARLQKMAANSGDTKDSIQFRVEEDEVDRNGHAILNMRRYDKVSVRFSPEQLMIGEDGTAERATIEFQTVATSLSLCVTDTGIIATITFSTEDPRVFAEVIEKSLRNQVVTLEFSEGANPYAK